MKKDIYNNLYDIFIKPYRCDELICFILLLIYSLANIIFPYFLQLIIDDAIANKNIIKLIIYIGLMVSLVVLMLVVKYIQVSKSIKLGQKITFELRINIIKKLLVSSDKFLSKYKVGDLTSIIENDVQSSEIIATSIINDVLVNAITAVGLFIIIIKMNWIIAVSAFFLTLIYCCIQRIYGNKIKKKSIMLSKDRGQVLSSIQELLSNISNIKMLNSEKLFLDKYTDKQNIYYKDEYGVAIMSNNTVVISTTFQSLGLIIVLIIGGFMVLKEQMTLGALFSLTVYIQRIYAPIVGISNAYMNIKRVQASFERILDIINNKDTINYGNFIPDHKLSMIKLKKLSFGYDQNKLFNECDMYIDKGENIAILGRNGCGKTTLSNFLLKLQEGYTGSITYNDIDLKDFQKEFFRDNIICLGQKVFIFNGTIYENIVMGKKEISMHKVNEAIKLALLEDDIQDLKDGLNTEIGEKGVTLSGGQQQKIALARIFLDNPSIIILDEPTAALDIETEKIICRNIYDKFKDNTLIIITHREELLKYCNRIYKIEEGSINEITNISRGEVV